MGVPLLSCFFATSSQLMHRMLQTSPQPAPLWRIRLSQGGQFSLPRVVYLRQGPHVSGLSVGLRLSFVALLAAVIVPLTPTSGRAQALFQCISGPNVAATSCGDPATASANGTTAIGKRATASGVNATALGRRATANDEGATAIGTDTTAAGTNASAFGINAAAGATGATAIGAGSVAAQTNSTAIGVGVASTRANQVIIGTAQQTITMPGVPNPASRAVQSGVVGILTTDENGNIATDNGTFEQRLSQVEAATANPTSTAAVAANTQAATQPTPPALQQTHKRSLRTRRQSGSTQPRSPPTPRGWISTTPRLQACGTTLIRHSTGSIRTPRGSRSRSP
jgi:hypothetical protein